MGGAVALVAAVFQSTVTIERGHLLPAAVIGSRVPLLLYQFDARRGRATSGRRPTRQFGVCGRINLAPLPLSGCFAPTAGRAGRPGRRAGTQTTIADAERIIVLTKTVPWHVVSRRSSPAFRPRLPTLAALPQLHQCDGSLGE